MTRKSFTILSVFVIATFALTGLAQTKPKTTAEKSAAAKPTKPQRIVYNPDGLPKLFATESGKHQNQMLAIFFEVSG